jgi:DNA modification methylase
MTIEHIPTNSLKEHPDNPRVIKTGKFKDLCESIRRNLDYFETRPILANKDLVIFAGHMRWRAAQEIGLETVPCVIMDISDERQKEIMIRDNQSSGEWDNSKLSLFDDSILLSAGFTLADLMQDKKKDARTSLAERFIVPPFSVFDTKQGYWQDRKDKWRALGIKSERGREDTMESIGSYSGTIPGYYSFKTKKEQELGHILSNKEFEEKYLDEMKENTSLAWTAAGGIVSIFDPVLTEVVYKWFIPKVGDTILDPFAGGSVRGIVANFLGYKYQGIDLSEQQIVSNREQAERILYDKEKPEWIVGDAKNVDTLTTGEVDFIFSCPPYFDLEIYSDDEKDLSNMPWQDFQRDYRDIIKKCAAKLKQNRFACFVVSEVRYRKNGGAYRNLVGETIEAFEAAGIHYYNEIVLLNAMGSVPIRAAKQFNSGRKAARVHQNVLIFYKALEQSFNDGRQALSAHDKVVLFYKGNPEEISKEFDPLNFAGIEQFGLSTD